MRVWGHWGTQEPELLKFLQACKKSTAWSAKQLIFFVHLCVCVYDSAFLTVGILTCHGRKSTGVTDNIDHGSFLFRCPSKTWQRAAKWSPAVLDLTIYTCAFPTATCQKAAIEAADSQSSLYPGAQCSLQHTQCDNSRWGFYQSNGRYTEGRTQSLSLEESGD